MGFTQITKPPPVEPGESAIQLDDGALLAVSIETKWQENGGGVSFLAGARAIAPDGSSLTCNHGQAVQSGTSYAADAVTVARYGAPAIAREVLLLVLGEEPTIVEKETDDGPHTEPMIVWSDDVRLNASIRHAMTCVDQAGQSSDVGGLLFG